MKKQLLFMFRIFTLVMLICSCSASSQSKKVLFLGNSYTGVNNLPQLVANLAESVGDEVIFDAHTPGGYTLNGHSTNATSLDKIEEGDWDFVVLQEQSQLPSFPIGQVETETFPFAEDLNNHIELHNPCAETMFYMTWGRENGDASNCEFWPPVCTYAGMDSLLHLRYMMMAEMNDAVVSPVGRVWKKIRAEHPEIDLYAGDGSHPSAAGSYAAACSFYTAIFRKDPTLLTYDFSVDADVAQTIRQVASEVVFQNLTEWYIGTYDLAIDYSVEENTETEFVFSGLSANATGQEWVINGDSFEETEVTYDFEEAGTYDISYLVFNECESQDTTFQVTISVNGLSSVETEQITALYPNPVSDNLSFDIPEMGPVDLRVFDMNGKLVYQIRKSEFHNFNVQGFERGLYYLEIITQSKRYSGKFLKQ